MFCSMHNAQFLILFYFPWGSTRNPPQANITGKADFTAKQFHLPFTANFTEQIARLFVHKARNAGQFDSFKEF